MAPDTIANVTRYFLKNTSRTHAKMFLIYKSNHQDVLKKFHAHVVEIDDDFKLDFNSIITTTLNNINYNHNKIKRFSDPKNTNEYRTIKKKLLPELEGLLEELEMQKDLSPITSIKQMEKINNVYCFQFKTIDKRIFVFAKIDKYLVPENEQNIVGEFKDDKLKKRKEELVIFDKNVFCIYFEEIETLLMLNYSNSKQLLNFKRQFKEKCAKILTDNLKDVFVCDKDKLDSILNNNSTNELLLKMYDADVIDNDKSHYKKWNEFYDEHPLDKVEKLILNDENAPRINSSHDLGMALYVSNNDIMEGVVRPGEYALVFSKEILKMKKPKSVK